MVATTPFALIGCAGPLSTIDPAGPHAAAVATLWWVMLGGATLLAALVFGLLAFAFLRRDRPRIAERAWIVWLGLVMPCVVLGALLIGALLVGDATLPHPAADAVRIDVMAARYDWRFRTPAGRESRDTLHLPAGRPVDLAIESTDVIHSLWIPRLAGKMDAIPGHRNVLRIVAARPGRFMGECAEYCGTGHRNHGFTVIAHDPRSWSMYERGGR